MTIEHELKRIADALEILVARQTSMPFTASGLDLRQNPPIAATVDGPVAGVLLNQGAGTMAPAAPAEPNPPAAAPTIADATAAASAAIAQGKRSAVAEALKPAGVTRVSELPAAAIPAFLAHLRQLAA